MRKITLTLLLGAGLSLMAVPAMAGDVVAAENPFDGFYAGLHAGYGWANSDIDYSGSYAVSASSDGGAQGTFGDNVSLDSNGWLLGAQLGGNFVMDNGLLIGAELSGSYAAISGERNFRDGDVSASAKQDINGIGLAQLKLGWANETFAIYGLGGLALGSVETSGSVGLENPDPGPGELNSLNLANFSDSQVVAGWTLGVGADMMVSDRISVGVAYNYVRFDVDSDFDVGSGILDCALSVCGNINTNSSIGANIAKATLNYHF